MYLLMLALACSGGPTNPPAATEAPEAVAPQAPEAAAPEASTATVDPQYLALFKALPHDVPSRANPITPEKVELGRMLFYDARLSENDKISCNSCHDLAHYGVDGAPTSLGHAGEHGTRNSPTVYNAALQIAQFWDGRAPTVEEQAKGPILNPVEMGMPTDADLIAKLKKIPGYAPLFTAAFPGEADPITYDHIAMAIGAFERQLMTPSPFDAYLAGDANALTPDQRQGLATFVATGCTTCHNGAGVGGGMYQKLGLVEPYDTTDEGRKAVTGSDADLHVFKVPELRNITETGPYFHDGSLKTLPQVVQVMAKHQLGKDLDDTQVAQIVTFLGALKGQIPADYTAKPALPD